MSDLTQEHLMNYTQMAIRALMPRLEHRMLIRDIQRYLREQWGIEESLWRIKEAEDTIYELQEEAEKHLHDFWLKPYDEQMRLSCKYGEPLEPLTDEEKQEMEGCGC